MDYTGHKEIPLVADFAIGDTVFLKTDEEQSPCLVTGITIRPHGLVYEICRMNMSATFYAFELSTEKDKVIA
jgi:hypothetical protein